MVTPVVTHPNIKSLLRARGLSQAEVARRMGISQAQLSRLLTDDPAKRRDWTILTLRAFAQATRIPLKEITGV